MSSRRSRRSLWRYPPTESLFATQILNYQFQVLLSSVSISFGEAGTHRK